MSDSRSRMTDFRSRPSSELLVDLHIYVVPPDIWRQKHHDVLNTDVNETISAGFIRVHPENKLFTLRDDIEQQLGIDLPPKEYAFMKCVGRSLTRVKPKQEYQLKVKNFLPPLAYLPEVYLLEVTPDVYGLSSGDGSSRAQTRTSLRHGDSPHHHGNRNRYPDDDLDRYTSRERLNVENERIRNTTFNRPDSTAKSRQDGSGSVLPPISDQSRSDRLRSRNTSHSNDRSQDVSTTPQPNEKPPLSATPPNSSDKSRKPYHSQPRRGDQSARTYHVADEAYAGHNYQRENGPSRARDEEDGRQRDDDKQRRREHDEARRRQREADRRRQEDELQHWENDRRALQQQLDDDEEEQKRFADLERQRILAEEEMRELVDESRLREDDDRRRFEAEEAQRRRDEDQALERREEIRRQHEAEATLQREEEDILTRQQEDDLRRIEQERLRLENDELMKQDSKEQPDDEERTVTPHDSLRMSSPDREMSEEEKKKKKGQKDKLQAELEKAREQRRATERQREELVRKAKQLQTKTQNRRNHARDVWKKRYFEEKKKTFPLDDQCNRLRHELDQIHRKLMNTLEGPKDSRGAKIGTNSPSEKNNCKIQATRLQHEIEDLKRRVENSKMKLTSEMKLRNQAETELRALRAELTQKKINLTLSRSQQLATLSTNNDLAYMTPRTMVSPRS